MFDGLCALSASAAYPYPLLTGKYQAAQDKSLGQDVEEKVVITDWGHGLKLIINAVESLEVLKERQGRVDCWLDTLFCGICATPWKVGSCYPFAPFSCQNLKYLHVFIEREKC